MLRLQSDEELIGAFDVMRELRPDLPDEKEFIRRVREGEEKAGYVLFGLESEGKLCAVCGVQPFITLYYDQMLWVCDLVTLSECRSMGYGKELLTQVEEWARESGYHTIGLSSRLFRKDAHRFYNDKMGYKTTSYVFEKKL